MADSIAGYPTGPLERFVTGFQTGYSSMTEMRKNSDNLQMQLAENEQKRIMAKNAPPSSAADDSASVSREKPFVDPSSDTTGSGGAGGGGVSTKYDPEAPVKIAKVLEDAGISAPGIAGFLGWAHSESRFNPRAANDINGGHTGLMQWDSSRWGRYLNTYLPSAGGGDPNDLVNQTKYWLWEQQNTDEKRYGVLDKLRNAKTPDEANAAVGLTERSGNRYQGLDMARFYHQNGWGIPQTATGSSAAPTSTPTQAAPKVDRWGQPAPPGHEFVTRPGGKVGMRALNPPAAESTPFPNDTAATPPPAALAPSSAPSGLRPPAAGSDVYSSAQPPQGATMQLAALQSTPRGQSDVALGPQGGEFPPYSAGYPDQVIPSGPPNPNVHHTLWPAAGPPALDYPRSGMTNPFMTPEYGWRSSPTNPVIEDRPPQIPPGWSETRGPQSAYRPRRRRSRSY